MSSTAKASRRSRRPEPVRVPLVLCPEVFGGQRHGIATVTRAAIAALGGTAPAGPVFVVSANDRPGDVPPVAGRGHGGHYARLMLAAAAAPLPVAPSLVLCLHVALAPAARVIARRSGVPAFIFLHGIEAWRPLRARERWGLGAGAVLLANSAFTRDEFRRHNPEFASREVRVVELGVAAPAVAAGARVGPRGAPVVLAIGRFAGGEERTPGEPWTLYKGFDVLVEAWPAVLARHPGARLALVGGGDALHDFALWLRTRPAARAVDLTGALDDAALEAWWERATVFALPSEREGFGLVFAEAMARGVPCVGARAGAVPEVIRDGETGLLVPPREPAALAAALVSLLGDPGRTAALARAGRAEWEQRFSPAAFGARLRDALRVV